MTTARFVFLAVLGSAWLASGCGGSSDNTLTGSSPGAGGASAGGASAGSGGDAAGGAAGTSATGGNAGAVAAGKGGSAGSSGAAAGKGGNAGAAAGTGGAGGGKGGAGPGPGGAGPGGGGKAGANGGKGGAGPGQGGAGPGQGGAGPGQGGAGPGQGGAGPGAGGSPAGGSAGAAGNPVCNDCLAMNCSQEEAACANDPKCGQFVACVQGTCSGGNMNCIIGCAIKAGITSPQDPAAMEAQALFQCGQQNCATECAPGGAGGSGAGGSGAAGASGSGAGGTGAGGGTGTPAMCQMAIQSCFVQGPCGMAGLKCQQTPGCQGCMTNGGSGAQCANNAAYKAVQACACTNSECGACCF